MGGTQKREGINSPHRHADTLHSRFLETFCIFLSFFWRQFFFNILHGHWNFSVSSSICSKLPSPPPMVWRFFMRSDYLGTCPIFLLARISIHVFENESLQNKNELYENIFFLFVTLKYIFLKTFSNIFQRIIQLKFKPPIKKKMKDNCHNSLCFYFLSLRIL